MVTSSVTPLSQRTAEARRAVSALQLLRAQNTVTTQLLRAHNTVADKSSLKKRTSHSSQSARVLAMHLAGKQTYQK